MQIIICPYCSTRVVRTSELECPSCRHQISDSAAELHQISQLDNSTQVTKPEDSKSGPAPIRHPYRSWAAVGSEIGCALYFTLILIGIGAAVFVADAHFRESTDIPLRQYRNLIKLAIGIVSFPVIYQLVQSVIRTRRLLHPSAEQILQRDRRPPVVFLRSFGDDGSGSELPTRERMLQIRSSDEERLVRSLRCVGPVIAIGRPREELPELGAHRMYVSNDDWQNEVLNLVSSARLVVLRTSTTPGLQWELRTLVETVSPDRIIIYNEPPDRLPEHVCDVLPADIASTHQPARFFAFDADWTVHAASGVNAILKRKGLYRLQLRTVLFWAPIVTIVIIEIVALLWACYQMYTM